MIDNSICGSGGSSLGGTGNRDGIRRITIDDPVSNFPSSPPLTTATIFFLRTMRSNSTALNRCSDPSGLCVASTAV